MPRVPTWNDVPRDLTSGRFIRRPSVGAAPSGGGLVAVVTGAVVTFVVTAVTSAFLRRLGG